MRIGNYTCGPEGSGATGAYLRMGTTERARQLAYSDIQTAMHDEEGRRQKARKIVRILQHFLGRTSLEGLHLLDIGSSTGFIASELQASGADVVGIDIDAPGLAVSRRRFGRRVAFVCGDGESLPVQTESIDLVVLNQIYEHVVNPDAVMAELRRVLSPTGAAFLGLGNRLGIMEPHHRLPFLSWLPSQLADRYVRVAGKGDHYHERFRTRRGLRRLVAGLHVWDYTYTVIAEPDEFDARDVVSSAFSRLPLPALKSLSPLMPTYLWVGTKQPAHPRGSATKIPPRRVDL